MKRLGGCVCLAVFAGNVRVCEHSHHAYVHSPAIGLCLAAQELQGVVWLLGTTLRRSQNLSTVDVVLQGIELHLLADSKQQQQ